jgi:hypothetical protein
MTTKNRQRLQRQRQSYKDRMESLRYQILHQRELGNNRLADILADDLQYEINRIKRNRRNKIRIILMCAALVDLIFLVADLMI